MTRECRVAVITVLVSLSVNSLSAQTRSSNEAKSERVQRGLLSLYDFQSTTGNVIKDRAGTRDPVDLQIADTKAVRRVAGELEIRGKTAIRSIKPARRMADAIRRSGEVTIEAWIRGAKTGQTGPARIITLSKNPTERNFTLGQEKDQFEVRLRTTRTSRNGVPALSSGRSSVTRLLHVIYTRDRKGRATVYVNGKRSTSRRVAGTTGNWDRSFRFALGNELTGDRPWLGTFYLAAIYGRALTAKEVEQNFKAGAGAATERLLIAQKQREVNARLFKTRIAPLLARRCVECHGGKSKKGRLDLTRKFAALRGGESGPVIVPGNAAKSALWTQVQSNDMPKDRTPLSVREKQLLKAWINGGAEWPIDRIDPAKYGAARRPGGNWLRRLTVGEYIETVRVAVGVDVSTEARKILPPDLRADGFSNTAYNLGVDLEHVQAYARLARLIVAKTDPAKIAARYSKSRKLDDANMRTIIGGLGKWILRGPLKAEERDAYLKIARVVAKSGGSFQEAVAFIVEGMLQSPRFLYRMEIQRGDGKPRPVGVYELASRLSYILWGAPPDRELMRAADADRLGTQEQIAAQVRRMLKDPRAITQSSRFMTEWLHLARLSNLRPDRKRFPKWDPRLAADMREETLAFFREVAWNRRRPLSDLFNAQYTFLTPRLATHYGIRPKSGKGMARYDVASLPSRGGLLTQGSVLTIGGNEASTVARGLFVLHHILGGAVEDPPPGVDTTPVPTKPGLSQRGVALVRIANKSCGGCHSKFEPLAFGLEKYDGLGGFHNVDHHGNKLREDGEIVFPGTDKAIAFKTSSELMNLLAKNEHVKRNLTRKVTQWALGRPLGKEDGPFLATIHKTAQQTGGTYQSLITAIVMSDLVRKTGTEKPK